MFITEWDQEKFLEQQRKETENDVNERVARDMLIDGKPLIEVKKYSRLAEDVIRNLANSLGIVVM